MPIVSHPAPVPCRTFAHLVETALVRLSSGCTGDFVIAVKDALASSNESQCAQARGSALIRLLMLPEAAGEILEEAPDGYFAASPGDARYRIKRSAFFAAATMPVAPAQAFDVGVFLSLTRAATAIAV